jgi:hypothetical protein
MSSYRWLRPLRASESMTSLPALDGRNVDDCDELLWEAVKRGDVRVLMNDVVVPKAHIAYFLILYQKACPEQPPFTLPPDIGISYDDILKVFDRTRPDNRKRGRPIKENSGWSEDRRHASEMHKMLSGNPDARQAQSAAHAARLLVDEGKVTGAATPENKAKRLERAFRKYYTS